MTTFTTLDELYQAMLDSDPATLDQHGQFSSSLPLFGGEELADTGCVWSWDETRLIVGTCRANLQIVNREDWG